MTNPVGRPTIYREEFCQQLIDHMSQGLSMDSFAGEVGISKKTIYNWIDRQPEFLHAYNIGLSKSQLWWEKAGRSGMFKGGFSASVWIFSMKNKFNWVDKKESDNDKTLHTVRIELPGQGTEQVVTVAPKAIEGNDDDET